MNNKIMATIGLLTLGAVAQLGMVAAAQGTPDSVTAIHGTVTDPSGAIIPGAMVTVSNGAWSRTISSDEMGCYSMTGLTPGHYRVRVHFGGFAPFDRNGFVVTSGHETEADAQLELREVRQTITVFE